MAVMSPEVEMIDWPIPIEQHSMHFKPCDTVIVYPSEDATTWVSVGRLYNATCDLHSKCRNSFEVLFGLTSFAG
jgi:hypothetical protein